MTAKTKSQQDDLAGPLTRSIRAAMVAIDKIAEMGDQPVGERNDAIYRIQKYAITVRSQVMHKAWIERLAEDALLEAPAAPETR
ncbi:MAG: hypothetical protein ACR2OE_04060 [Thermomicrobiales bacterium]